MRAMILEYLFGHFVKVGIWPVVHHRVGKHQKNVPLVLKGIGDLAISYSRFDSFQVNRSFDDIIIVWGVRNFHWAMEYAPISKLANLVMVDIDDGLKYLDCFRGSSASLLDWR